jgi:hypothetical protein
MSDSRFENRYFDIFKYILDSVFIPEEIFQTIDKTRVFTSCHIIETPTTPYL